MKLIYKVLWIENETDWLESVEEGVRTVIEDEYSFDYEQYNCRQKEDGIDYNKYDLILMDLNLDGEPSGDKLIQEIRDNGIYTDVVFYSAGGLNIIKEKARELDLEGVYFSGRDKRQFTEKVKKVIETTIKKVQDLNNLRGLVMAEVSELDAIMDEILNKYYITPERMEIFHKKITSLKEKDIHKLLIKNSDNCDKSCYLNYRDFTIDKLIPIIDSSQKAHSVHELLQDINSDNHLRIDNKAFYKTYFEEIIEVRNQLAHCNSKIENGQEILRTRKGIVSFDANDFKRIRANVKKYNQLFTTILRDIGHFIA